MFSYFKSRLRTYSARKPYRLPPSSSRPLVQGRPHISRTACPERLANTTVNKPIPRKRVYGRSSQALLVGGGRAPRLDPRSRPTHKRHRNISNYEARPTGSAPSRSGATARSFDELKTQILGSPETPVIYNLKSLDAEDRIFIEQMEHLNCVHTIRLAIDEDRDIAANGPPTPEERNARLSRIRRQQGLV